MNKVQNLEDERRAKEASSLLHNEALSDAFKEVEQQYLDAMLTATEKDDLGRFRYAEAIKVVRLVRQQLINTVGAGKLASHELELMGGKKRRYF